MNKTVNINLAGIFFHIDEDAYAKLQRYLEAIKRSFRDPNGRNEIISDIEARISELFTERIQNEKQVISIKEVEEVITIMGQPEDYIVDEEIFEDEPQPRKSKQTHRKLFRDTDNAYIGGVSSGLSHYFNIDPLWIRLIWVALFFGAGTGIFIYILLWILLPVAESTSDKLSMSGKPVNITNIEQKVKEGFSSVKDSFGEVTDKVKSGDYNKAGDKIKSSSRSFFDALGNVIMFFFKIVAKFIGVILIIVGASTLIALFISLFSVGTSSFFNPWWMDYALVGNTSGIPIWLVMLITFFAVGIPFFFIFLLGLKILVNNLKSIGRIAKFSLLGVWLVSFLLLLTLVVREATEHSIEETVVERTELNITSDDTLTVSMAYNDLYTRSSNRFNNGDFKIVHDENDNKKIYSSDIRLIFKSTKDSVATIAVKKSAQGRSYKDARETAGDIQYNYAFSNNELLLDNHLLTDFDNKFRDQEVTITLYLPEGSVVYADDNTYHFHRNRSYYNDILDNGMEEHYLKVIKDDVICLDCPEDYKVKVDVERENGSGLKLDEDGLEIKTENGSLKIDNDGLEAKNEDVNVTIDDDGIEIKTDSIN